MPYIKIWLHFVWSTKNRQPLLRRNIRQRVFRHILKNARSKDIFIDHINGHVDHLHCLVSLGSSQTVAEIARLIKGESSRWINRTGLCREKFGWQDDYFVSSVGEPVVEKVRRYIRDQEIHHRHNSFEDEYRGLLARAGFKRMED